jgi:threonine aldolase
MIDLRSDTVTLPTKAMYQAMATAELGDDVRMEDPTVNKLQEYAAELMGKEAALFMPTGTMANLVAIMAHTPERRSEIIVESGSHIFLNEAGGYAHIAGVSIRAIDGVKGMIEAKKIRAAIRNPDNIHHPVTRLLCLENTHNSAGGTALPIEYLAEATHLVRNRKIATHLDGARIFNAALATGVKPVRIAGHFDSVMFCLSKGLSAPVGSMLTGSRSFIQSAIEIRKMLGGGMRQAGILAAAGLVALQTMIDRLADDHQTARIIAEGIVDMHGNCLDLDTIQTNIIRFELTNPDLSAATCIDNLKKEGLLALSQGERTVRLVTHRHIDRKAAHEAAGIIRRVVGYLQ